MTAPSFSAADAPAALAAAADAVSAVLGCSSDHELRRVSTWVGGVLDDCVWLRVGVGAESARLAATELYAASAAGPAVARPALDAPLAVGPYVVTVWELLEPAGLPGYADLGGALAALHSRPPAGPPAPLVDQVRRAMRAAVEAGLCSPSEARRLVHQAETGRDALTGEPGPLGWGVVHHDAHLPNVVVTPRGPRLVDLEICGLGLRICDFAAVAVDVRRYGLAPSCFDEVVDAYRSSGGVWDGGGRPLEWATSLYESWVTAWAVNDAVRSGNPDAYLEARVRIDGVCNGSDERWHRR